MELQKKSWNAKFRLCKSLSFRNIFILHRRDIFFYLLLNIFYCKFQFYYCIRGGIEIQKENKYYNQKNVIDEIHVRTGCSYNDITKILNSLGEVIKNKVGTRNGYTEIKLFPGLKIISEFLPEKQYNSNLGIVNITSILKLKAEFSKNFKQEIKEIHKRQ